MSFCSRAICMYLAQAYGKDDSLFPKDPKKQAVVNQRLQFDLGTLYAAFADQYVSVCERVQLLQDPYCEFRTIFATSPKITKNKNRVVCMTTIGIVAKARF